MLSVTSPFPSPYIARSALHARRTLLSSSNDQITALSLNLSYGSSTPITSRQLTSPRPSIELLTNATSSASSFIELISRAREGLKYHSPELCEEGVNGTYFLKDKSGETIAVFKPQDEEANSENNPKRGLDDSRSALPNKGILPGEAASREVAAHLLDHEHLYGVPRTQLVKITHDFDGNSLRSKIGSLQEFIENDGSSEDFGSRSFPISEVHKIGILDIQILNVDRHAGNILVRKRHNSTTLTPIDQGFSMPDNLECPWFEWMNWPQSKLPFDDDIKSYISRIDIEKDAEMLAKELAIRPECLHTMKITTTLLKRAAELDMTLYDIGLILCRTTPGQPSILETIYAKAQLGLLKKREIIRALRRHPSAICTVTSASCDDDALLEIFFNLLTYELAPIAAASKRRKTL